MLHILFQFYTKIMFLQLQVHRTETRGDLHISIIHLSEYERVRCLTSIRCLSAFQLFASKSMYLFYLFFQLVLQNFCQYNNQHFARFCVSVELHHLLIFFYFLNEILTSIFHNECYYQSVFLFNNEWNKKKILRSLR